MLAMGDVFASAVGGKVDSWTCSSLDSLQFQLVSPGNPPKSFSPMFSYQVFGEEEVIYGYKDLKVVLKYSSSSLKCLLQISFSQKNKAAQDISLILQKYIPKEDLIFDQAQFEEIVSADAIQFKPMGDLMKEWTVDGELYQLYTCTFETPKFKAYHKRLQTFLLWFIEGASFIEDDDLYWQIAVLYKKLN